MIWTYGILKKPTKAFIRGIDLQGLPEPSLPIEALRPGRNYRGMAACSAVRAMVNQPALCWHLDK